MRVQPDSGSKLSNSAERQPPVVKGTERIYPADLVILALGGETVESNEWNTLKVPMRESGVIRANTSDYVAGIKGLFACGDCRTYVLFVQKMKLLCNFRGPSIVAAAIAEGRDAARALDNYLKSCEVRQQKPQSCKLSSLASRPVQLLPSALPSWSNPVRRWYDTRPYKP